MIPKQYRDDYSGEFVITNTVFRHGKKEQTREWVDNPISVSSHSKRACCIAPDYDTRKLSMERLEKHRGGLLGRDRMQLYAGEKVWKDIKLDFAVMMDQSQLDEVVAANYQVDNVVYTSSSRCLANAGEFYLVPMGVYYQPIVTVVWLSCFDGHKEIYLYGYNVELLSEKAIFQIRDIMQTYNDVQFYHVQDAASPDAWQRCTNHKTISTRDFISLCDI